jgi:hypothetical protein
VFDNFDSIVLDDSQVRQLRGFYFLQKAADAGGVNFERDEVVFGMCGGDAGGSLAHAGTDFENGWRMAIERDIEVQQGIAERQAELRGEGFDGVLLRGRYSALAKDVAADGTIRHQVSIL